MGEPFGKYILHERIGLGGMAEVFRATLPGAGGIDKPCVLKRILPHYAFDPDFVRMFLDEARISILLQHGNIVPVLDFGEAQGTYYIAMEHVAGKNLREVIERSKQADVAIPITVALFVTIEVCRGLAYAHDKVGPDGKHLGLIHRDVSPSNVLVSYEGDVRLVDFGIAKVRSRTTQHTGVALKGKIPYMSPEQARGLPIDPRTDVWATGIVLYQMLTGRRPFQGADELNTLELVREGAFALPRSMRPDVPAEVEDVVCTALSKKASDRFDGARAMQVALSQILGRLDPTVTSANLRAFLASLFAGDAAAGNPEAARARGAAAGKAAAVKPMPVKPIAAPRQPAGKAADPRARAAPAPARALPTVVGTVDGAGLAVVRDSAPTDPDQEDKTVTGDVPVDPRKTVMDPTYSSISLLEVEDETELSGVPEAVKLAGRMAGQFQVPVTARSSVQTGPTTPRDPPILLEAKKTVREVPAEIRPTVREGDEPKASAAAKPLKPTDRIWPAAPAEAEKPGTAKERSVTLPIIRASRSPALMAVAAVGAVGLIVGLSLLAFRDPAQVAPTPVPFAAPAPVLPAAPAPVEAPPAAAVASPAQPAAPQGPVPTPPPAPRDLRPHASGAGARAAPANAGGAAKLSDLRSPANLPDSLPADAPTGILSVNSTPWAEVFVDGRRRAESTPVTLRVPAGSHVVRLFNPEIGVSRTLQVEIRAGETTRLAPQLAAARGNGS
ncbi:MAG: serine/threonine protein kinase [Deltaproteobacteria bacterium]|nr:serine/threonine protein kinase [Deltaproteobacteria bacterium]